MLSLASDAVAAANDLQEVRMGTMYVGASQTTGVYLMPKLIGMSALCQPDTPLHSAQDPALCHLSVKCLKNTTPSHCSLPALYYLASSHREPFATATTASAPLSITVSPGGTVFDRCSASTCQSLVISLTPGTTAIEHPIIVTHWYCIACLVNFY